LKSPLFSNVVLLSIVIFIYIYGVFQVSGRLEESDWGKKDEVEDEERTKRG